MTLFPARFQSGHSTSRRGARSLELCETIPHGRANEDAVEVHRNLQLAIFCDPKVLRWEIDRGRNDGVKVTTRGEKGGKSLRGQDSLKFSKNRFFFFLNGSSKS